MIEETILKHLSNKLNVPVYLEYPEEKPINFVVIEKTSSGKSNHICSAMLAIQSVSGSMYGAAELNESVIGAMEEAVELDDVASCRLNTDYNFTDPDTKQYRYQAVFDITHY